MSVCRRSYSSPGRLHIFMALLFGVPSVSPRLSVQRLVWISAVIVDEWRMVLCLLGEVCVRSRRRQAFR